MGKEKETEQSNTIELEQSFPVKKIRDFVVHLRKKSRQIEEQEVFCNQHKFLLEAASKRNEAEAVRRIIHELENEFDLGFVWDSSLD